MFHERSDDPRWMRGSDDENGGFSSPQEDNDSLTGYESANEGTLRRKMDDTTANENVSNKKPKMDNDRNKTDKKKDKPKDKNKNKDANGGLFGDGWQKNRVFKTFIMEPKEDATKQIHIMEIAKLLTNIKITYQELVQAGRNRFKITFANPRHAEQLINSKVLTDDYKYRIFVPTMYQETIGVIRNVPPSISESELLANIVTERLKIKKVERIMKLQKKDLVPTYSVKIFVEGEKLPREVKIYGLDYEVDCYIFPMKCCVRCVRYGHFTKACKAAKVRCYNCSNEGHEGQDCKSLNMICIHCKNEHKAFDPDCKERLRQDNIRKAMAYNKLSFMEAAKLYPVRSEVQLRLQDTNEFPELSPPENQTENNINTETVNNTYTNNKTSTDIHKTQQQVIIPNKSLNNTQTTHRQDSNEYITKAELEKIVNTLKVEIIKQLNITKIINKIKQIQETIVKNITKANEENSKLDNRQILINISNQLNELVNPEILQQSKPPDIVT